jgi:hypothetical protein
MFIYNFLKQFQVSPFFSKHFFNSSNFLDFSLSNYSMKVALLCSILVMIINIFSFFYEVSLWIQTNVSNGVELAVAAIQTSVGVTKIVNVFSILIFIG